MAEKRKILEVKHLKKYFPLKKGKFKEGDVAYLDRIEPTNEKIYGDKANYRISSVREQNRKLAVYFEKIE